MSKRGDRERNYRCRYCGALEGEACLNPSGRHHTTYHQARVNRAVEAEVADADPAAALEGLGEEERGLVARMSEPGVSMAMSAPGVVTLRDPGRPRPTFVRRSIVDRLRAASLITTTRRSPAAWGLTSLGLRVAALAGEVAP